MLRFLGKHKENRVLLILVILCFILIGSPLSQHFRALRSLFLSVFIPGQKISMEFIRDNHRILTSVYALLKVQEENLDLQEQVYRLKEQLNKYQEALGENERLRGFLRYKKELNLDGQLAKVIGSNPRDRYTSVWLDKGSMHGVEVNAVALGYQKGEIGVVGRIIEVSLQNSRLLLITDQESEVTVVDRRSRCDGILKGENMVDVRLAYFLNDADMQPGDVLLTSGKGGIFPPGLKVGVIKKVFGEQNKLFTGGFAAPVVNLGQLEEVLLLRKVR